MRLFRSIPRNVWILGLVSLLTDVGVEMIYALLSTQSELITQIDIIINKTIKLCSE